MREDNHTEQDTPTTVNFTTSSGIVLATFLVVGGLLLIYEHRIHLLTERVFLYALLALCVVVHFFVHGRHGSHSDKGGRS
jgi:DUF2933 family protein